MCVCVCVCVCVWWAYFLWHIHLHMCVCWSCHTRHSHRHPSSPPHHCTHITQTSTHMHTHTQTHKLYRNCIKVKREAKIRVCLSEHNISSTRNAFELETVTRLQHYTHTKNHFPELCTLNKQAFQQSLQSSYRLIQCIRLYDGRPTLYL